MNILQMLVQGNYVDSPIQDCAQVWSKLLFYNYNHRGLTYQIAMPSCFIAYVPRECYKVLVMQLSVINKANFLFSLTVMFLECCTYVS